MTEKDPKADEENEGEALPLRDGASEALSGAEPEKLGECVVEREADGVREGRDDKETLADVLGECALLVLPRALLDGRGEELCDTEAHGVLVALALGELLVYKEREATGELLGVLP